MTEDFRYDVFVSYRNAEADSIWVRTQLVPRLTENGLHVCVDYEDFELGKPLVQLMEEAVVASRYTLAILTPAYLRGPFATFERALAAHLELEQQQRRLLVAMREPTDPPLSIRYKLWLDMTDDTNFDTSTARLCAELRRRPND
jgi:TIR domain